MMHLLEMKKRGQAALQVPVGRSRRESRDGQPTLRMFDA